MRKFRQLGLAQLAKWVEMAQPTVRFPLTGPGPVGELGEFAHLTV